MSRARLAVVAAGSLAVASVALATGGPAVPASAASTATATSTAAPTSFTFLGAGFGHGVGMSQYGAYAQALAGRSASQILGTYYPGTTLGTRGDNRDIEVGLGAARPSVVVSVCPVGAGGSATTPPALVVRAGGQDIAVPTSAPVVLSAVAPPAGQTGTWVQASTGIGSLADPMPVTTTSPVQILWTGTRYLAGPDSAAVLTSTPNCTDLGASSGPSTYRYGQLLVYASPSSTATKPAIALVNELRLGHEYLDGIAEMPSSWGKPGADGSSGAAALQAQAIAARGYALRKMDSLASKPGGVNPSCLCHVLPSTADQVFVGWKKAADPTYGRYWTAAVDATENADGTGDVVLYGGGVASTNYYSSSGGRTENVWEVWNSSQATYPYLRSVDDPWSLDPAAGNPYRSWTRTYSQAAVTAAFGLPDVVRLDLSARTTGGSLAQAVATSSTGTSVTLTGASFRAKINSSAAAGQTLRSAWFRLDPTTVPPLRTVTREAGATRWATAARVADATYPGTAPAVVIASGVDAHLVDGLVAGPLAASVHGPVLLVGASVPDETAAALSRLMPTTVYVIGGGASVPEAVLTQVKALLPSAASVVRLQGKSRYDTAAAVAERVALVLGGAGGPVSRPDVVVASGQQANLADALAVGGPAGALGRPVLLTESSRLPDATRAAMTELRAARTIVVGGPVAVSDAVLADLPSAQRVSGADRYATAVAVASTFDAVPVDFVVLAGGEDAHLVDALPAGALGLRILLTPAAALPTEVADWLGAQAPVADLTVVGGEVAVSAKAADAAAAS